jgi:hypothetical protein
MWSQHHRQVLAVPSQAARQALQQVLAELLRLQQVNRSLAAALNQSVVEWSKKHEPNIFVRRPICSGDLSNYKHTKHDNGVYMQQHIKHT